ncbi:MAG: translocation/assembly module TamB domain-containing protein [Candidatus Eremiobacteraeota bacterium]|nr:translocation/assembly module TamB domain-containing protein [Candidatus Eremiobacteraeota bacterium]
MRARARAGWQRGAVAAAILALVAAFGWLQRETLAANAVAWGVGAFTHTRVSYARASIGWSGAHFDGLRVRSAANEPIADIDSLDVALNPSELAFGGSRRFGLSSFDVEGPHLTIIRHPDGSYNIPKLSFSSNGSASAAPFVFTGRIRNGTIDVYAQGPVERREHHLKFDGMKLDLAVDSRTRSRYDAALNYLEGSRRYPISGSARIDASSGLAVHHWHAPQLPIAALFDFVVNSPSIHLASGELEGFDARYAAPHFSATTYLQGARLAVGGMAKPVRDVRGRIDVDANGVVLTRLDGSLAGVPVRVTGSVFDLRQPQFRLAVHGTGDLHAFRGAFDAAARLPVRGPLDVAISVEGPISNPLTWISLRAPHVQYAAFPFSDVRGTIALAGNEADVVDMRTAYAGIPLQAQGGVTLQKDRRVELLLGAAVPADTLPYFDAIAPGMPVRATVLAQSGDRGNVAMRGAVLGRTRFSRFDGSFDVDSAGNGTVGPFFLGGSNRWLYLRAALDRTHDASTGVIAAHDAAIHLARTATLPGVRTFDVPPLDATLNGTIAGQERGARISARGAVAIREPGASVRVAGTFGPNGGTARGRFSGSLAAVSPFVSGLPVHGSADVPIVVAYRGGKAIAEVDDARVRNAPIGGNAVNGTLDAAATIAGLPNAPRVSGTALVRNASFGAFPVAAVGSIGYARGTMRVGDGLASFGPALLTAGGTVAMQRGTPAYDLAVSIRAADVSTFAAMVQPRLASIVDGSIDADLAVRGSGAAPGITGTFALPEGSVNGLAFRDLHGALAGTPQALDVERAGAIVGSSSLAFAARTNGAALSASVRAPHVDLQDFNDLFDTGDTLNGTGSVSASVDFGPNARTSQGDVALRGARFHRFELGTVAAHWQPEGNAIRARLALGGKTGEVHAAGTIGTGAASNLDVTASVRGVDLKTWLPMLGFNGPVTGALDADATVRGRYPELSFAGNASVVHGTVGRVPVDRAQATVTAANGRGIIHSATVDAPGISASASGGFGLHRNDPLSLHAHVFAPDVGAVATEALGKRFDLGGSFETNGRVEGTLARPNATFDVAMDRLHYGKFAVAHATGTIRADRSNLALQSGVVDLEHGRLLADASIATNALSANAPVRATLTADDLESADVADLLPKGTKISGRLDGRVTISGRLDDPRFDGAMNFANGTFVGPMERVPLTAISAQLAMHGDTAQLRSLHADAGGGTLDATMTARVRSLRDWRSVGFTAEARANHARLDLPAYFKGTIDGDITASRAPGAQSAIALGGTAGVSGARIPLSALFNPGAKTKPASLPLNVAFNNLQFNAGDDVRVVSPNVDVGGTGALVLNGTLAAPQLTGTFSTTGGTVSFYRTFALEDGSVSFDPAGGIVPYVDVTATTFVSNPPTNVRLTVRGPASEMQIAFDSDPPYDNSQILGLLVGAQQFGAVSGIASTGGGSSGGEVQALALGQVNQLFTRNLLEPLSVALQNTLGFTNLQVTNDLTSGLGISAMKAFGKTASVVYADSLGYPQRSSLAFDLNPNPYTAVQLRTYQQQVPFLFSPSTSFFGTADPLAPVLLLNQATAAPMTGTSGIDLSYQRKLPP